jgi:hypothetical protein
MHDKRVQKGNTYAAMVIPAGSYPDTFGGSQNIQSGTKRSTINSSAFKSTGKVSLIKILCVTDKLGWTR